MRTIRLSLSLLLLAAPAAAQQVEDCAEVPPVTALVEPWEETSVLLGEGAVRVALLHGEGEEGERLLVLTLPLEGTDAEASADPPPERRCRIVTEGGLGFARLDVAGLAVDEDPEAGLLTLRVPARRFIPESTELEELTLILAFGTADGILEAVLEISAPEGEPGEETGDGATGEEGEPEASP